MDDDLTTQDDNTVSMVPVEENSGQIMVNMENMIKSHISSIDKLDTEIKKYKGLLDDIFNNDEVYQQHDKAAKEATKVKQSTRAEVLKRPQPKELAEKLRGLKSELKELKDGLSDYLQEYQRMSGVNEIEGDDGEIREIVYSAKLIKKGSIFK